MITDTVYREYINMTEEAETPTIVPGRWLVSLRPLSSANVRSRHVTRISTMTGDASTTFNCDVHKEFELPECKGYSATFDDATKAQIEQMDEVSTVEPVQLYRHFNVQQNAPWGLSRVGNRARLPAGSLPSGSYTYNYPGDATGKDVMAYVLDTGINSEHVEFEGRAIRGPKFVTPPRPGVQTSDKDVQGHGTHCAGTIASRAYGVAKKATVVGVKVFNDLPDSDNLAGATNEDIVLALQWVVDQVKVHKKPSVVNLSLGGGVSNLLDAAVAATVRSGVVVCVAAGNATGPSFIPKDASTISPARVPLAITVAATNIKDEITWFSYFGKFDIVAPGEDILSCWCDSPTDTKSISGTSMACPHVAGVACCLFSDPQWTEKDPSLIVSEILIRADKNKVSGLTGNKVRTIDAVVQVSDS